MDTRGRILIIAIIITCVHIQVQGADKYTDGNRPYEFGFSIDGEQHRHEKKDEKGLIEGEFGFITADGVYHVTVYATDEQGRFKILSMKNIRVKPYPTYTAKQPPTSARQGHSLDLPASLQTPASPVGTTVTFKPISIEPPGRSCSACSIPKPSTPAPFNSLVNNSPNQIGVVENPKFPLGAKPQSGSSGQPNGFNSPFPQQTNDYTEQPHNILNGPGKQLEQGLPFNPPVNGSPKQVGVAGNPTFPLGAQPQSASAGQPNGFNSQFPQQTDNYPSQPQNSLNKPVNSLEQDLVPPQYPQNFPQKGSAPDNNLQGNINVPGSNNPLGSSFPQQPRPSISSTESGSNYPGAENPQPARENVASGRTPKRLEGEQSFGQGGPQPNGLQRGSPNSPTKPTLISAQMQIVNKNTDIYKLNPGEKEGLPEGLSKDDMSNLLYTFNYTVGFHGHFEEGYTNGVKQGYYFVTGRNGVRTRIDYVADSKGFHPKISQEVLDLLSDDVPKPETEKEEKYGLKGYEFKWLYYPVEAKGR